MQVYDSDRMLSLLKPFGYESTQEIETANLVILNTCNIREKAEQKIFSELGRLREYKKEQEDKGQEYIIAVGGCVAQAQGNEIIRQAPYVSLVFGPQNYHKLPEYLIELLRKKSHVDIEFPVESKFDHIPFVSETKASTFLTIQEGCNKFCHFCVVPYTRGAEYSRPVESVLKEARHLIDLGAKEITLLGQNVNAYHGEGSDGKTWSLANLIESLALIKGLERIRYTTSHPRDMTDHLLECHGNIPQLMPYLHLPVQSGSDRILKEMNRKHKAELYYDIIRKLKIKRPDIMISSDFIVGYPGETAEDHQLTLQLIQDCVDVGYSFNYSPRPGTPASVLSQVDDEVKMERLYELQAMLQMKQLLAHQKQKGLVNDVLIEKTGKEPGQLIGKNDYFQSVFFQGDLSLIGSIIPISIKAAYQNSLEGLLVA